MGNRAAIWARTSTTRQDAAKDISALRKLAEELGLEVTETFTPHKSSYHGDDEAGFRELCAGIPGKYTVVLAVAIDRLSRRGVRYGWQRVAAVEAVGGAVRTLDVGELEDGDETSELLATVGFIAAKRESKEKSNRAHRTNAEIDRNKGFRHGPVPLGYRIEGEKLHKRLIPDEKTAALVAECFMMISNGKSLYSVEQYLADHGVVRSARSFSRTFRNRIYSTGSYKAGSAVYKTTPLVSVAVQEAAIRGLETRSFNGSDQKRMRRTRAEDYSALVSCEHGNRYYRMPSRTSKGPITYYRCRPCRCSVRQDLTDARIDDCFSNSTEHLVFVDYIAGDNIADDLDQVTSELRSLDIDADDYDTRHAELVTRRRELLALDPKPAQWRPRMSEQTIGEMWPGMSYEDRVALLRRGDYLVTADKQSVTVKLNVSAVVDDLRSTDPMSH